MSVAATLDLLRQVIGDHEQRELGDFEAVQIVHEDAETPEDARLFTAALLRAGGAHHACSAKVPPPAAPGPINEPLARHLEAFARERGTSVELREVDGIVIASVDGNDVLSDSAAILGQAYSFLCSDSMTAEIASFSYPLAELDVRRAGLIWDAVAEVSLFRPDRLQTLISIALGDARVDKHCNPDKNAVRFVVRDDKLIKRQSRRDALQRVSSLVLKRDDPIVLFLGAGASASARMPMGDTLRNRSLSRILGMPDSSDELVSRFWEMLKERPERYMANERELTYAQFSKGLTLERVLREEFYQLAGRPRSESRTVQEIQRLCSEAIDRDPPGRRALRELAELLPRLVIGTINFDELIETDLSPEHLTVVTKAEFAAAEDLVRRRMTGEEVPLPILKVHGSISDVDSMIADLKDTSRGLPPQISSTLDAIFADGRVTWIWIGCSMRDLDLGQWLRTKEGKQIAEFWVDPLPPQSVADYISGWRASEWARDSGQTITDRQITESSDVFLPLLLEHVKTLT